MIQARSVTLRSILALFEATGDEGALSTNLGRFLVARAVLTGVYL